MTSLSQCEIDAMQTAVEGMYDNTLDIYRSASGSTDAYGGHGSASAPTLQYSDIPCEIYPGTAHVVDMPDIGLMADTQMFTITVPLGTDVQKDDIVVITSAGNLRLRVNVVLTPESQAVELRFIADEEVLNG